MLHLIGSHADYEKRYPKENALYKKPSTIEQKYDNTIFYTNSIIQNIVAYFSSHFPKAKILYIYLSDHGVVVNKNRYGHGFLPPFRDEYDTPFLIHSTAANKRIEKLYKENSKRNFI